jgi:hypothetical protein
LSTQYPYDFVSLITVFKVGGLWAHSIRSRDVLPSVSLKAGSFSIRSFSLNLWRSLFTAKQLFPSSFTPVRILYSAKIYVNRRCIFFEDYVIFVLTEHR